MAAPVAVEYWFSTASPWAWLGSAHFAVLARQARVEVLPIDLGKVFAATGGLAFGERSQARQSYRQLELARWARHLGVPLRLEPRFYPVDREPSSRFLIAARLAGLDALALSHAVLRAIWGEDRNIADWPTLEVIARDEGADGRMLVEAAQADAAGDAYQRDTQRAIDSLVFGSPTYIVGGERFWGQDRLAFLAERLG